MKHKSLLAYIPAHFIVDFTCAFLLFRLLDGSEQFYLCLLLYNFCAFALQMPIGLLADRWNRNILCAATGCCLIAISFGMTFSALIAAIIAGIGNCLFHIGGGIDVLNVSNRKPILLGLFVAPGALGIYLGTLLGGRADAPILPIILGILLTAVILPMIHYIDRRSFRSGNAPVSFSDNTTPTPWLAVCCLFGVVCLRSYLGIVLNFSWKGIGFWSGLLIAAIVSGKIAGGFLMETFGAIKASAISLSFSTVLFLFANWPIVGILAVLLFNMSMPVTLWAMARVFPGCKGFSFGLLTFALFLGFIPVYLEIPAFVTTVAGFSAAAAISLLLLLSGLRKVGTE